VPRENKFRKAEKVTNWDNLHDWLRTGGWIYWGNKLMHPSFIISMTYRTLDIAFKSGNLYYATSNTKEVPF
jgi:hypothetical protein